MPSVRNSSRGVDQLLHRARETVVAPDQQDIEPAFALGIEHPPILGSTIPLAGGEIDELGGHLKTTPDSVLPQVTKLHLGVLSPVDSGDPGIKRRTHAKTSQMYDPSEVLL